MEQKESFWAWQNDNLRPLLLWGTGSVVVGVGLARARSETTRNVGIQALAWGAVDLVLALNGRRGARARLGGKRPAEDEKQAAASFRRLVAINAGLDVLYLLGGFYLARAAADDARRRGTGRGILIQGLFLLIYDLELVRRVDVWQSIASG